MTGSEVKWPKSRKTFGLKLYCITANIAKTEICESDERREEKQEIFYG